jgi:hypothetical protein
MKFMKYLFAFALALAFGASASVSQASGVPAYVATGSSALFLELGQAATALSDTGCYWTQKSVSTIAARDDRPTIPITDENGSIWIAWGKGTGTCAAPAGTFNIYSEMSLDSVLGQRCYFMVNSSNVGGCLQIVTIASGTAGAGLLGTGFSADTAIPAAVISALNNSRMNAAATDIRPEDGKFASARMFTPCTDQIARNPYQSTSFYTSGLGYQTGTTGIGTAIQSFTNAGVVFHVYDFNITGTDPISGGSLSTAGRTPYVVSTVGAQPQMITVGPVTSTGIGAATDIPFSTLSEFVEGGYGRTTDLEGPTATNAVVAILREPLSGTYNTFEFSVPNSNQFQASQEIFNCNSGTGQVASNPMNIATVLGNVPNSRKIRAIGTGEEVAALINPSFCPTSPTEIDCIGYWFWSAGNAANFTATNQKYLTLNGVDPILDSYGDSCMSGLGLGPGVIPNVGNSALGCVTFKGLNAGDYAIWSPLRIVSTSGAATAVGNLITGAESLSSTQNDFVPITKLKVWHSHFGFFGVPGEPTTDSDGETVNPATPGDLCNNSASSPEQGGDVGGMTISIQGNHDFCSDFNTPIGISSKSQ